MNEKARSTIGDTLSDAAKLQMGQLISELREKAKHAVALQLKQPKYPAAPLPMSAKSRPISSSSLSSIGPNQIKSRSAVKPEFSWWELPLDATVRELPPNVSSPEQRRAFKDILAAFKIEDHEASRNELFVNVGLDFGTSSTKVVVRFPFEPGEPTFAIPAPAHCRSDLNPYLWQTVVWLTDKGEFTAWPQPGTAVLQTLKQGIVEGHQNDRPHLGKLAVYELTNAEAAVAYLAFVIRYVRGWLISRRPDAVKNRHLVWFENIGLPAATLDQPEVASAYRSIIAAAHLIAGSLSEVNVISCRAFLQDASVQNAARSADEATALGVAVIPETAAEASAFFNSAGATDGAYLLVDVGAMTLDICMFGYQQGNYQLFTAMVRPLGVESFHWFINKGRLEPAFKEQCQRSMWSVVWDAKKNYIPQVPIWNKGMDLPVFLVGGGSKNALHRQLVEDLGPWLRKHTQNDGIRFLDLPIPQGIDLPEPLNDFGRMAVAWGLSYPADKIGEVSLSSTIERITEDQPVVRDDFVSKDQV